MQLFWHNLKSDRLSNQRGDRFNNQFNNQLDVAKER